MSEFEVGKSYRTKDRVYEAKVIAISHGIVVSEAGYPNSKSTFYTFLHKLDGTYLAWWANGTKPTPAVDHEPDKLNLVHPVEYSYRYVFKDGEVSSQFSRFNLTTKEDLISLKPMLIFRRNEDTLEVESFTYAEFLSTAEYKALPDEV